MEEWQKQRRTTRNVLVRIQKWVGSIDIGVWSQCASEVRAYRTYLIKTIRKNHCANILLWIKAVLHNY